MLNGVYCELIDHCEKMNILDMNKISNEFCLATLLLVSIFIVNTLHILYLIVSKPKARIKSIRLILLNVSISSLIVSMWLIPFFYFRSLWSPESFIWRLWSYMFHITDAVQIYSLLLLLIIPSLQCLYICFIWFVPIIAYSPLLWLTTVPHSLDYLPYRLLTINVPRWILVTLYCSMYFIPLLMTLICISLRIHWSRKSYYSHQEIDPFPQSVISEHDQDMAELTSLVKTVLNFHLPNQSKKMKRKFQSIKTSKRSPPINRMSSKQNRSLSYQISPHSHLHQTYFIVDELSTSSKAVNTFDHQSLNSSLFFILTSLVASVHLPYLIFSLLDRPTLQLSLFIYIHWFATLLIPLIHLK